MMIKIAGLYERTSEKTGVKYLTGRLNGGTQVLVLQNLKASATDAPPWELFIAEAPDTLTPEKAAAWEAQHAPESKPDVRPHQAGDREPTEPRPKPRSAAARTVPEGRRRYVVRLGDDPDDQW